MEPNQNYMLNIKNLFAVSGGAICSADAEIAIMDSENEIDRVKFSGKAGSGGNGYRRSYAGKPGLTAKLVSGPGQITFEAI
jgi:hypothetical protein